jgi:hypothetical protein
MPTSCCRLRGCAAASTLLFLLTIHVQAPSAQSLGEVARRETERRTRVAVGRVYTNEDLAPDAASLPSPAPVAAEAVRPGASAPGTPTADEEAERLAKQPGARISVEAPKEQDEQYWRSKAEDLRGRLAKATAGIATAQARLSEIDAAPQTPTAIREREVIAATRSRLQRDANALSEGLARFRTQAVAAGVPLAWTR